MTTALEDRLLWELDTNEGGLVSIDEILDQIGDETELSEDEVLDFFTESDLDQAASTPGTASVSLTCLVGKSHVHMA